MWMKPNLIFVVPWTSPRVLMCLKNQHFLESRACWIKYMEPFFHDLVDDILMTSKLAGSQDFDFKGYRDSPEICLRFSVTMGFACGNLWFRWSGRHGAATGQPEKVGTQPQCVLSLWVGLIKINEEWHILYTDIQSSNPCWSLPCEDTKISWSCTGTFAFFDVLLRMMVVKIHRCNSFLHEILCCKSTWKCPRGKLVFWIHWRPMLFGYLDCANWAARQRGRRESWVSGSLDEAFGASK